MTEFESGHEASLPLSSFICRPLSMSEMLTRPHPLVTRLASCVQLRPRFYRLPVQEADGLVPEQPGYTMFIGSTGVSFR